MLASQSDVATFFLDSIDELKLTLGSFQTALKRLSVAIGGQLGRTRIVITTRPIPVDEALIRRLLPVPAMKDATPSEVAFAEAAMNRRRTGKEKDDGLPVWRNVALLPLSNDQIREMAALEGLSDAEEFLKDIRRRNAEDFARRPQDLIELCADWRDFKRIRTHREQVAHNIAIKLRPRTDRAEKAQLTQLRALEGASRLALAALLTRKLTLRHSAIADRSGKENTALDPASILLNWPHEEQETLLERALFGFSSYGRVRFHHRSVIEYLAAHRLDQLLNMGMSIRTMKRLLFAEPPQGIKTVKPSMRPVAAWLACSRPAIFSEIRDREPEVLLIHADPESLPLTSRVDALRAFVGRYGHGGWRGKNVPRLQVHRLASTELDSEIVRLWHLETENPDVKGLLMELVAEAPTRAVADIAHAVLMRSDADIGERIDALDALLKLDDPRLEAATASMENEPERWPLRLLGSLAPRLLPRPVEPERLCRILAHLEEPRRSVDMFKHLWSSAIADADIPPAYLEGLREGLTEIVTRGVAWRSSWPHLVSPKPHLLPALAAVCLRQIQDGLTSEALIRSSVQALRLARDVYRHSREEPLDELRKAFQEAEPLVRRAAFWADDAYSQSLHPQSKAGDRFFEVSEHGPIQIHREEDEAWVLKDLSNSTRERDERELLLVMAMAEFPDGRENRHEYIFQLRGRVADNLELLAIVDDWLKPISVNKEYARMQAARARRVGAERRSEAKASASWMLLWREVANTPEKAFSPDRSEATVRGLWQVMRQSDDGSRESGWNRRFIEEHFSHELADRLREVMKRVWRNDRPTLRTERPEAERNSFFEHWLVGLSALAAEAEDPKWAYRLSHSEAELAARYAPLGPIGSPTWLVSLVDAHPSAVEALLGPELTSELESIAIPHQYGFFLQSVRNAAEPIAKLFLPRIRSWLEQPHQIRDGEDGETLADRLRDALDTLLRYGGTAARQDVRGIVVQHLSQGADGLLAKAWLPFLMQVDPDAGTELLEHVLDDVEISVIGRGAEWIGLLFGDRHQKMLVDPATPEFSPFVLLRLVRIAYRHVHPSQDIHHESAYSPGPRDHAERGRNVLLSALLDAKGQEGWMAKLELASDPMLEHFRDRALAIACEKAAEQSDMVAFSESQFVVLDRDWDVSPATNEEMFGLLMDRLDDMEEILLRDDSPRSAWALISDERIMRREIARELDRSSNRVYTVDQEGVTADEKETDIRLRVAVSGRQAAIELKLGDDRSASDLRDSIRNQLVIKYMASDLCRSGCLLITINRHRKWEHPESGERLDVEGLKFLLQSEAEKINADMHGALRVAVRILDLRPRLSTERHAVQLHRSA